MVKDKGGEKVDSALGLENTFQKEIHILKTIL